MKKFLRLARLSKSRRHRAALRSAERAFCADRGGEALEHALVVGWIVIASIGVFGSVAVTVATRWSSPHSRK